MHFFSLKLWRDAIKTWSHAEADQYSAAVAYFTPFALIPLVFISIAWVGLLIGTDELIAMLASWGEIIDPTLPPLIADALVGFTAIANQYSFPYLAVLFFSFMILVTLNSFTAGLHAIWGIERSGVKSFFSRYGRAFLFIIMVQGYLVFLILATRTIDLLTQVTNLQLLTMLTPLLFLFSTIMLFTVAYRLLPLWSPSFAACVIGASVAGVLFTVVRLVVAFHFATAPTATLFGAATVVIVLLVWFYAGASIIFFGAAFAKVYDIQTRLAGHTKTTPITKQ